MKHAFIAIAALFLAVYVLPLGRRPLVIPDETRYAEIPREMLDSGNWTAPRLAGLRYFEKPVFGYWMNAASMLAFGQNAFAARLPAALSAGLAAALIFLLVRRTAGSAGTAFLAVAVFLTSSIVFAIGVFNVLDSHLALFVTGCIVFFVLATDTPWNAGKTLCLFMSGLCCGMAFLTKGFLAFAVPVITIVPFMVWERRWKQILALPWIPAAAALLVSLPWCIAVAFNEPDYWRYFFWIEHVKRFTSPGSAQHPEPFWYFVPVLIGGALPWTALWPAAVKGLAADGTRDRLVRLCLCWLAIPFFFFSMSRGKLGTYILPCLPPLSILVALGLARYRAAAKSFRMFRTGAILCGVCTAALAAALTLTQTTNILPELRLYGANETGKWIFAVCALGFWSVAAFAAARTGNVFVFALAPALFFLSAHSVGSQRMFDAKAPGPFLLAHRDKIPDNATLVSDAYIGPAVCWFYRRTDILILGGGGELKYGLAYDDSKQRRMSIEQFTTMVREKDPSETVVLIIEATKYFAYDHCLPEPLQLQIGNGFAFARY